MTNEVPKFEDMPLPIRTHENYTKVLKSWLEVWKKETDKQIAELKASRDRLRKKLDFAEQALKE